MLKAPFQQRAKELNGGKTNGHQTGS